MLAPDSPARQGLRQQHPAREGSARAPPGHQAPRHTRPCRARCRTLLVQAATLPLPTALSGLRARRGGAWRSVAGRGASLITNRAHRYSVIEWNGGTGSPRTPRPFPPPPVNQLPAEYDDATGYTRAHREKKSVVVSKMLLLVS